MRVIFRARFQGPTGALNPLNLNMALLTMTVDVFAKSQGKWFARANGMQMKLFQEPTHGCMKDAVTACFEKQLSPWQLCNHDGEPLDPDYVVETPEGNFSMREVTHCGSRNPEHSRPTKTGPNYFIVACGTEAHASLIRSYRSAHPPVCKECRKEWEKTKPEERLKA